MNIYGMYFSGTGTTEKIVTEVAGKLQRYLIAEGQDVGLDLINFTSPDARQDVYRFGENDTVVFGVPVIAGRVPNVLLPFLETIEGGGAIAVPIVLYGNRDFDDALIELRDILEERGFRTIAAAAFIGEHSFSRKLAAGRPDDRDMAAADRFAASVAGKLNGTSVSESHPVEVDGQQPLRPYYKPRDRQGNHIDILKVRPRLDEVRCTGCGICVRACPMGSIKADSPGVVDGICIKCCGCEKKCPEGALYFDDPGYLYHKEELELAYGERKEPKVFL